MSATQNGQNQTQQKYEPLKLRHARLLLQIYHSQGQSETATIDEFLNNYAQQLMVPPQAGTKLQEQLQIAQYNHLNKNLAILREQSERNLLNLQELSSTRYKQIKDTIAQKQSVCLDNIENRLNSITPANESNQQLTRVKKILDNGLWGCLARLNDRLAKLNELRD